MIVDSPMNIALAIGQERRRIENGDAQLSIPPVILPVLLGLQPHTVAVSSSVVQNQSVLAKQQTVRVNQAAITQTIITLGKGLWELEMTLATQFNYLGAVGTLNGSHLQLLYPGPTAINLLERFAQIGTFTDYNRMRLLLTQDVTLQLVMDITGVGQNMDASCTINCIRIL